MYPPPAPPFAREGGVFQLCHRSYFQVNTGQAHLPSLFAGRGQGVGTLTNYEKILTYDTFWRSPILILQAETSKPNIMILLTVYKESAGQREKREFARLQEAIEFGQKTGLDYEIYDPVTGKVIDWNEINVREDDDWYYDEKEYLWKKFKPEDDLEFVLPNGDRRYEMTGQKRKLRCA